MRSEAMLAGLSLMLTGLSTAVFFLVYWVGRLDRAVERYRKASLQATETWVEAVRLAVLDDISRLEKLPSSVLNRDQALEQAWNLVWVLNRLSPPQDRDAAVIGRDDRPTDPSPRN